VTANALRNEEAIFHAARAISAAGERDAYVAEAAAHDAALRARVETLLKVYLSESNDDGIAPAGSALFDQMTRTPFEEVGGTLIDRYKLLERLGEGGFGMVYMAEQQYPVRRKVALKVIKPGLDTKQVIARFEAERQALAMMEHENIAKVLDAGATSTGRPYFVMELVRGVPITDYCNDNGLSPPHRLRLFVCVCRAVQHAHTKGIIHRDIKPTNVLVTLHDGVPVPKVIDFGVAKATGQQSLTDRTLFTQFAQMVGTPLYMSPEQAEMSGLDVDTRSDVYALGVVLYELLTGTTPFDKQRLKQVGHDEVRRIIREEEPPRPSTRLSTMGEQLATVSARCQTDPRRLGRLVRGELDWIVMKALDKDRTRRYETAAALAQDVERYLEDEPVHARAPSTAYRFKRFARRNKVALLTIILFCSVLLIATLISTRQAIRATAAEQDARRLAAELALDKSQSLGEAGEVNVALLWLTRSLQTTPPSATELQSTIRTSLGAWQRQVDSLRMVLPHDRPIFALGITSDGDPITASGGDDAVIVRRWRAGASDAGEARTFAGESNERTTTFSADASLMLAGRASGVRLVNLATGRKVWERQVPHDLCVTSVTLSPDETTVLIGYAIGPFGPGQTGRAQLHDAASGKPLGPALDHPRAVQAMAFHPDGKSFVTECGHWNNTTEAVQARFWNLQGRETRPPLDHPCAALAVAFAPDGTALLTGHWDRKARVWDLSAPAPAVATAAAPLILPHEGPIVAVAFAPGGNAMLTGSFDGAFRVWDRHGRLLGPPVRQGHMVDDAIFSRDGRSVLVSNRTNCVKLWDLAPEHAAAEHRADRAMFPLATSADGRTILTQNADHLVALRNAATNESVAKPLPLAGPLHIGGTTVVPSRQCACSNDRRRALTVEGDVTARLWDVTTGAQRAQLQVEGDPTFFMAAFSPDSKMLVTGGFNWTARLWDAATGQLIRALQHETASGPVFTVAFSPDGTILATGGADTAVRFWDPQTGEPIGAALRHHTSVTALAFSPDGRTVLTGDADKDVQLWDVATRTRLMLLPGHRGGVSDATFSPDGRLILTGSRDGSARLWSAASGKPIGPALAHALPVIRVAFSHDGKAILIATQDQLTRSWPVPEAMAGSVDELALWAQVATGMELEQSGAIHVLDAAEWWNRRAMLSEAASRAPATAHR
jgi:WD40 repeat protein/serine/threonine protein kinase